MFEPTAEQFTGLCAIVGQVALPWTQYEGSVDHCVVLFFEEADKTENQDGVPISYKRKIIFLKKKFKEKPYLQPFRDEAAEIFGQAKELNKVRNDIIHGWVSHFDPEQQIVHFTKLAVRLEQHYDDTKIYTLPVLIGVGQKCLDLATRFIEFAQRVAKAVEAQDIADKSA